MQVFITYTRKRKEFVGGLAKDMKGFGHEVWFDRELTGGQDWWNEILKCREEFKDCIDSIAECKSYFSKQQD